MTKENKLILIGKFKDLSNEFEDTLKLKKEIIIYRPDPKTYPDPWSIIENIMHCVEFDVANFHRYRWAIVSPGTAVLSFDGKWTKILNYHSMDLSMALNAIKAVRSLMAFHLKQIADDDWTKYRYTFPNGKGFNLEEALQHFINHVGFHRELIDRNIKLYSETK